MAHERDIPVARRFHTISHQALPPMMELIEVMTSAPTLDSSTLARQERPLLYAAEDS